MHAYVADPPPTSRNVAMAYAPARSPGPSNSGSTRAWEDLRKEARKLEGELDVRLAAFAKLCSGVESTYRTKPDALGTEQLAQSKASEIDALLGRLSDVNGEMAALMNGVGDARSHTLARHRDILQEFTQEYRRLSSSLGAARDRAELLGSGEGAPLLSVQVQSSTGALLRERAILGTSTNMVDDMLRQAQSVSTSLLEQRRMFDGVQDKLGSLGERFPVVNGLLNAIRRKKSKDTLVLASVIAACTVFTVIYLASKSKH